MTLTPAPDPPVRPQHDQTLLVAAGAYVLRWEWDAAGQSWNLSRVERHDTMKTRVLNAALAADAAAGAPEGS